MVEVMKLNSFSELSQDELKKTDGGAITALGVLAFVGSAWVCYEIGYAAGKAIAHFTSK